MTRRRVAVIAAVSALVLGCSGKIGDPNLPTGPGGTGGAAGGAGGAAGGGALPGGTLPGGGGSSGGGGLKLPSDSYSPTPSPLRRLTSTQLENTTRDLFTGFNLPSTPLFPRTVANSDYTTFPQATVVSESAATDLRKAAQTVAQIVARDLPRLLGCDPSGAQGSTCTDNFIAAFAARAYRRPTTSAERQILRKVWDADSGASPAERAQAVVEAVLQSPQFLYLDDKSGQVDPADAKRVALDGWALASRLSYFLWNSMPDATLQAKAEAGKLRDRAELLAEARRLLADPRARAVVAAFHVEYLDLAHVDVEQRDTALWPQWNSALVAAMQRAYERFVQHVVFDGGGTLSELLTSRVAFVNKALESVYKVQSGSSGASDFRRVTLPASERAGLLTRALFAMAHANTRESAPVHRGKVVLERLLCRELEPPPGINATLPQLKDGESPRERLARHRSDPACSACHDIIDPIGFAFERYDAVGVYRNAYASKVAIDSTGDVPDLGLKFNDGVELSTQLAHSETALRCYARHWLRYALGRRLTNADANLLQTLQVQFIKSKGHVQTLLLSYVGSDAFRLRPVTQ